MEHKVILKINGKIYKDKVCSSELLLDFLVKRAGFHDLGGGCGRGECGRCIVMVNGRPINACLTLVMEVNGEDIIIS